MALAEAPPVIDHVSVTSSLDALDELGFSLTPTKGSGGRHGRVMLDRTYLEVTLERGLLGLRPRVVSTSSRHPGGASAPATARNSRH